MTEDQIKLAGVAYAAAMYNTAAFGSNSYEERWGVVDKLREELKAPYAALFNCFDFSCGPGWWAPLETAFKEMQVLQAKFPDFPIRIVQIKEKFGDLRLYTRVRHKDEEPDAWGDEIKNPVPDELWQELNGIVGRAEIACADRCEVCGDPGEQRHDGWIKTLCDVHAAQRKSRDK